MRCASARLVLALLLVLPGVFVVNIHAAAPSEESAFRSRPVMFIENVGQFNPGALFQVRGGTGTMWLAEDAIWISLVEASERPDARLLREDPMLRFEADPETPSKAVALKLSFVGANSHPRLEPFNRLDTNVSYFFGSDPEGWRPGVPVWGGVRYEGLYPGLDLELAQEQRQWNWRMVRQKGAGPEVLKNVRLRVDGAEAVRLHEIAGGAGRVLRVSTAMGELSLPLLQVSTTDLASLGGMGQPQAIEREVCFPFAPSGALVSLALVDNPGDLLYSTFLGGGDSDEGRAIAVDAVGAAYVAGTTWSDDFPSTPGAYQPNYAGWLDAFVTKLSADGSTLLYSTFLGGENPDKAFGIAVDAGGVAHVTGETRSADFPTTFGAFDTTHNGWDDAFAAKLNADGTALTYSTFLGGARSEQGSAITLGEGGAALLTGHTGSGDFPTSPGSFDTSYDGGVRDTFVAKLSVDGSSLVYSTFIGGNGMDLGYAMAVDGVGGCYLAGYTSSSDFPTLPGAYDAELAGNNDIFVAKLSADGTALVYGTYLGGTGWSRSQEGFGSLCIDGAGSAYLTGYSDASDFPTTPGAYDTAYDGGAAWVVKVSADGSALVYATWLGSGSVGSGIAVDGGGVAHVTGYTDEDFPTTPGAYDTSHNGGYDVFVTSLSPDGSELLYSTFLGGSDLDMAYSMALDRSGAAFVTGEIWFEDFPTTAGAYDTSYNGGWSDAFVAKLGVGPHRLDVSIADWVDPLPSGWKQRYTIVMSNTSSLTATNVVVSDTLPAMTYPLPDESTPGGTYDEGTHTVFWELGELGAGESVSLELAVGTYSTIREGTILSNTVWVGADGTIPVTASERTTMLAPIPTETPPPTDTPTATPTVKPSATPTLTPSPTGPGPMWLPLVYKEQVTVPGSSGPVTSRGSGRQ